jgi:hypothetical protein
MIADTVTQRIVLHQAGPRHCELPTIMFEDLSGGAAIIVAGVVVDEVLAREGGFSALGFVEYWDVGFDPAVMDKPVQHLGRAVGAVPNQPGGVKIEALH